MYSPKSTRLRNAFGCQNRLAEAVRGCHPLRGIHNGLAKAFQGSHTPRESENGPSEAATHFADVYNDSPTTYKSTRIYRRSTKLPPELGKAKRSRRCSTTPPNALRRHKWTLPSCYMLCGSQKTPRNTTRMPNAFRK